LLVLNFMQTAMIFPGAATQGRPEAVVRPPVGTELLRLRTAGGEAVAALFGPALPDRVPRDDAARRPTVIYFYGNGMCLADSLPEFDMFRRLGLNVLVPDYVGYGMSGGKPSESALYATADAGYEHLRARMGVEPSRIIAAGWSLGGAVAIDLAHRHPVGALMVFSAFTSTVDMARRLLPLLPHSLLVRHRFENLRKIAEVRVPTLIAHGRRDGIVPYGMSEQLRQAAAGRPLVFLPIAAADHNDFFQKADAALTPALAAFVESLAR
jgi:pimeloyl-ACP methyl ester carboxylesterase